MTTNPRTNGEAQRRALIRQRRESSTFWAAVHLLGSLNMAVTLLASIAALIAYATVIESKFDTAVAKYYIYDNPLFMFWLLVLGLNLACAALTRWPWQRKHLGFVTTHAGIILMLIGGVVGRIFGFEAFVTLDKTHGAERRLITHDNVLTLAASDGVTWQLPVNFDVHPPTSERPLKLTLENTPLHLVIDKVTENLVADDQLVPTNDLSAPAAVRLHLVNPGMNQNVPVNLLQDSASASYDFFGLARIEWVASLDESHLLSLPVEKSAAQPGGADGLSTARDETPFRETYLVLTQGTPVIDGDHDQRSGFTFQLATPTQPKAEPQLTVNDPSGVAKTFGLADLSKAWKQLHGDGDPISFHVAQYWPDFAVQDGKPISVSSNPRNPAVLVQLTGPSKLLPPSPQVAKEAAPPLPQGLVMRLAPARGTGKVVYELERAGKIEARQVAAEGETFLPGWSKWQVHIDQVLPHGELHREVKEASAPLPPMLANQTRPGLHAYLVDPQGHKGLDAWIPAGTSRLLLSGTEFSSEGVHVGFGQRAIPLNFSVSLENFEVPRDEGTQTPSNYISTLRFQDFTTGREVHGTASMNSPAMFPGDFWRSVLGWNYKFSQANWNPQNLNETTLQVLYDPGWPFKWVGSLGICLGITLMFYFMPKRSTEERAERGEEKTI